MLLFPNANWLIWLGALWLLWMPGRLLVRLLRLSKAADLLVQLALQIGLGLAFWPVLFLWTSTFGWQWSPPTAQAFVLLLSIATVLDLAWSIRKPSIRHRTRLQALSGTLALFGLIVFLTLWTRVLHIWSLALPAWVDSVHHTMIVRLLVAHGALPATYDPFIPQGRFFYHWGYHAIVTWVVWWLGRTEPLDITQIILHSGQLLNTLTVLMLYAAGRVMFQNRRAGLLAATLAGLISWFPAFYVSWGRYPQLAGLLVLCAFTIMLWQDHLRPTWGHRIGSSLLGAGLFLIHTRVVFFALTLVAVLMAMLLVQRAWRTVGRWLLAGPGIMLLTLPWLWSLLDYARSAALFTPTPSVADSAALARYYGIQADLLWAPHNRELLALATGGISGLFGWGNMPRWEQIFSGLWLLCLIGLGVWHWSEYSPPSSRIGIGQNFSEKRYQLPLLPYRLARRQRGKPNKRVWTALGVLIAWCTLTALILNLDRLNLPRINIITNNSGIITLFIPLSLAGGGLLAWVIGQVIPHRWVMPITALLIIVSSTWGAITMLDIVNPVTILATTADVKALNWIRSSIPANAHFAVDVRPWLAYTYIGSDGGYWIQVLTDRQTIVPPALYASAMPDFEMKQVNELLDAWSQAVPLDNPTVRKKLQTANVTYIYIGANGDHLKADYLRQQRFVEVIYQDGPVYIFKLAK